MMMQAAGWVLVVAVCGPAPDSCVDQLVDGYVWPTKADCDRYSGEASEDPDAVCLEITGIVRPGDES